VWALVLSITIKRFQMTFRVDIFNLPDVCLREQQECDHSHSKHSLRSPKVSTILLHSLFLHRPVVFALLDCPKTLFTSHLLVTLMSQPDRQCQQACKIVPHHVAWFKGGLLQRSLTWTIAWTLIFPRATWEIKSDIGASAGGGPCLSFLALP
jgi:hypothetical protein